MSPADLAVLGTDYSTDIEQAADPAGYIIQACERAKTWLAHALEHGGIEQIVELKSQAEAIRVYTMSKQLGKDAQLSAAEIVRRAERGIGLAIRRGQANGEIKTKSDGGWKAHNLDGHEATKKSVDEFFGRPQERADTYAMTDGVTDEQFEAVIAEGRAAGNLSRAQVARASRARAETAVREAYQAKAGPDWVPEPTDRSVEGVARRRAVIREMAAAGYTSRQMSDRLGTLDVTIREIARKGNVDIPADKAVGSGHRRIDPNRVVRETVHALDGLAMGVGLVIEDLSGLDPAEVKDWATSLNQSLRVLNRLNKMMKEMTQ